MADLFAPLQRQHLAAAQPLAARMRPRTLDQFVGQEHILGEGRLLRRMIVADRLSSVIFYGPPGTGKTTLAQLIAAHTKKAFVRLHAAAAGVKELREVLAAARAELEAAGRRTVLFIDEIHRFSRNVQDVLLADVEEGIVILVGATTENPFFAVNAPLVSRSQIFQFESLTVVQIRLILQRAASDKHNGLGNIALDIAPEAETFWATASDGDARRALAAMEIAVLSQRRQADAKTGPVRIDLAVAKESMQRKAQVYDATGDEHYDVASALIKSMRGSDPDAAMYWLARMLAGGEDPRFIARRIAICASEDIGNADPMALVVANAAVQVTEFIGLPECQLTLAQAVAYLACSPKSNAATLAIQAAVADVKEHRTVPVPRHLRDTHYAGSGRLGHSGYEYPHDHAGGYVVQEYLGVNKQYYRPSDRGHEKIFQAYLEQLAARRSDARPVQSEGTAASGHPEK